MATPASDPVPVFERNFEQFLDFLNDEVRPASISPKRFGLVLNVDMQTLAANARVHRNTISRAPQAERVQQHMRETIRVVRAASDVCHSIEKAIFWFKNHPLPVFDYKTAQALVSDGRAADVIRYLQSLQAGFAG